MAVRSSHWCKAVLWSIAVLTVAPAGTLAGDRWDNKREDRRRVDVRVDVEVSRDRFKRPDARRDKDDSRHDGGKWVTYEKRVWVEPVYRTVKDRVWVEPVYRDVRERVWREAIHTDRIERVWIDPRYEYRDVVRIDWRGHRVACRERVCVEEGRWEMRRVRVCVREGFYEDVCRRELVCDGHWKTIGRRECVSEGYWTTRLVREQRNGWHGDNREPRDRYARGDRGDRYDD